MSSCNNTRNLLNIKDDNIFFSEDCVFEELKEGRNCKIVLGTLTYTIDKCPHFRATYPVFSKNGFEKSDILVRPISGYMSFLRLRKQRYICRNCRKTTFCKTDFVKPNCYISEAVKHSIALDLAKTISLKDIAKANCVSHTTVLNVIDSYFEDVKLYKHFLPSVICFDEFKSVKKCKGNMSFLFVDFIKRKPIDIVEDRRLNSLRKYFSYYTLDARRMVKFIVIDMYTPYITLIKEMFPNAKIITDKFHVVNLVSRSLNKTRINIMKNDKKNYNKLKRYWKIILKSNDNLELYKYRKFVCFNKLMSEEQVLNYLLDCNEELLHTYWTYQNIVSAINKNDRILLNRILNANHDKDSDYMKTSIKTLIHHREYIENMLESNYTNGLIEGINNKIKVIKRVSYGYANFHRFKRRILICFNIIQKNHQFAFAN